jgi:subtilisin family serine protease
MPSIGLWLVRGKLGADGLELAARLSSPHAAEHGVRQAFPNLYLERRAAAPFVPNDPRFPGQWYFDNLDMSEAWGLERGDPGTSIVVVDTGCDLAQPDLVNKLDPGLDVADGDDDPSCDPTEEGAAHGTACAGIVGAETDNGIGIAGGCPDCRLRCVRLLTDTAVPLNADVEAFQFALEVDAAVVSNSWGFVESIPAPQLLADAIDNVFANGRGGKGALVIFAAGNDDREILDNELEALPSVLSIGAITNFDEATQYTNFGNSLDLVAYTGTLTTDISGAEGNDPTDYTSSFGGTSSACPVVAGIAGLLTSAGTAHTAAELYQVMVDTATPAPFAVPDANGHDPTYGFGIVQPVAALESVLGLVGPGGGGAGGSGAGGSAAGGSGTPTPTPSGGSAEDEGGCQLGAGGSGSGSLAAPWLALGLLGAAASRARRRRN